MASVKQVITDYLKKTYNVTVSNDYMIFGIRGCTPDKDGDLMDNKQVFNHYDDTIGILNDKERFVYTGTVEPGKKYTITPMNPAGAYYLKNGLYVACRAIHFGHDAFNIYSKYPKGNLEGYRDTQRNGFPDRGKIFLDGSGVDIHAGGKDINNIDGWSAGCQVVFGDWNSKEWKEFKDTLYKSKQANYIYCLLDYAEIKAEYEK